MPFIVFEGAEACGKSTQLHKTAQWLTEDLLVPVHCTREPGGTPLAEDIRHIFKKVREHHDNPLPFTEALLITAARCQHRHGVLAPLLAQGTWVLCDRFADSTLVYQGLVGTVPIDHLQMLTQVAIGATIPDLVLVFDVDVADCAARLAARTAPQTAPPLGDLAPGQQNPDRLDSFGPEVHSAIAHGYRTLVKETLPYYQGATPTRVLIPTHRKTIEEVHDIVKKEIQKIILTKSTETPEHSKQ